MAPPRTRSRCRELLALAALAGLVPDAAAATRLDDSLSPRQRVDIVARWEDRFAEGSSEAQRLSMVAEASNFEIRLNTAAWVGKQAAIYVSFPQEIVGLRLSDAMRIEWRTRGRFVSGATTPGQRALVYRGRIDSPVSGDFFDFTYRIDGRYFDRRIQFQPVFEIEALP